MSPIHGVELITAPVHIDARGEVIVFEGMGLPFVPARMFLLRTTAPDVVRGGHANSCDELIVAASGSVRVELDNGMARAAVRLARADQALLVRAGVAVRLLDFVGETVLLVCASARYADTRHFARPQPHLTGQACQR